MEHINVAIYGLEKKPDSLLESGCKKNRCHLSMRNLTLTLRVCYTFVGEISRLACFQILKPSGLTPVYIVR
jgi:hypothetical protein